MNLGSDISLLQNMSYESGNMLIFITVSCFMLMSLDNFLTSYELLMKEAMVTSVL